MPCGPPRRTGFLPRSGKFKGSLYESRCFLTPGAGHVLLLCLLIRLFFHAGKSALHWAAAVNNVEATLLLLKNGANRDMQDNKVRSGLRAGGREAAPREAGPSLSSHRPLVRSQDTERSERDRNWVHRAGAKASACLGKGQGRALRLLGPHCAPGRPVKNFGVTFLAFVPCVFPALPFHVVFVGTCFCLVGFPTTLSLCSWSLGRVPFVFPPLDSRSHFPSLAHLLSFIFSFPLFLFLCMFFSLLSLTYSCFPPFFPS